MDKNTRKHLKDEINSLLSSINHENQEDLIIDTELDIATQQESPYDFEQMSHKFTKKARDITDALFKNFLDIGVFEKNDYAKHKKELDTINISNLFFQLKTLKITIIKVMEEITSGNTHPRLLEVMGQLQDKMAAITKTQANYILFLEDTYHRLNSETPMNSNDKTINSSKNEGKFFITVGTKNVSKSLNTLEKDGDQELGELVDPSKKSELMRQNNITQDEENPDDFIDLTEII